MPQIEKDIEAIGRAGTAAWTRIKKATTRLWSDWMTVGEALTEGRTFCMQKTGTNRPEGKAYNQLFSEYLVHYKLEDIDKSARAKLLKVMEHRSEIEAFRAIMTQAERMEINHPTVMLRKWQAATMVRKPKATEPDATPELEAHIEELEAARESFTPAAAREAYRAYLRGLDPEDARAELAELLAEFVTVAEPTA